MLKVKYSFLLLSLLASIMFVNWFYKTKDFEQVWFMKAAKISDGWASFVRQQHKPCIILGGGSEVRTRYNSQILLEEFSLCTINAGEHAGYGMLCNAALALMYARPGDTLLMSFVGTSSSCTLPTSKGMSAMRERIGFFVFRDGLIPLNSKNIGMLCCGKTSTFVGALRGLSKEGTPYWWSVYKICSPSGWMSVQISTVKDKDRFIAHLENNLSAGDNSDAFVDFVNKLQSICKKKEVRLIWFITPQFADENTKVCNAWKALMLVRLHQKVLKDEQLGVNCDSSCFADTDRHPSISAAEDDTRHLGQLLTNMTYWREEELERYLELHGYRRDGSKTNLLPGVSVDK